MLYHYYMVRCFIPSVCIYELFVIPQVAGKCDWKAASTVSVIGQFVRKEMRELSHFIPFPEPAIEVMTGAVLYAPQSGLELRPGTSQLFLVY